MSNAWIRLALAFLGQLLLGPAEGDPGRRARMIFGYALGAIAVSLFLVAGCQMRGCH